MSHLTVRDPRAVQQALHNARAALAELERELLAGQPTIPPGLLTPTEQDVEAAYAAAVEVGDLHLLKRDVGDWSPLTGITIAGRPVEPPVDADVPRKRKKGTKKAKATKSPAGARTIELCPSHGRTVRDYVDGRTEGPLFRNSLGRRAGYDAVYAGGAARRQGGS